VGFSICDLCYKNKLKKFKYYDNNCMMSRWMLVGYILPQSVVNSRVNVLHLN
jgi:hypothetical protein